jgi:CheY-like chemotaxis protein
MPGAYVLLVDDDETFRDALTALLTRHGYRVVSVKDGEAAVAQLCQDETPDLILLDLKMPGMDGVQFRQIQRQYLRWAAIPVVVLSGSITPSLAAQLQVAATLPKNTPLRTLLDTIEQHRQRRESLPPA